MLHETIRNEVKEAMLAKDKARLSVVRAILSSFVNELVAQKKKPQETLPDADALKVIKRLSNQRKDSIEQFKKGGREDLVAAEEEELAVLKTYLPQGASKEDIRKVAEAKKTEMGITDRKDFGKLMGAVMKELGGTTDGSDVKQIMEELFN